VKICEYENVRCPFCGEDEKLVERARCSIQPNKGGDIPAHAITCKSCGGTFAIECQD